MRIFFKLILSTILLSTIFCSSKDKITGPGDNEPVVVNIPANNTVLIKANIIEEGTQGNYTIMVDVEDKTEFKRIYSDSLNIIIPVLSNDRKKILFNNIDQPVGLESFRFVLYDIENDEFESLNSEVYGRDPVWFNDSSGFIAARQFPYLYEYYTFADDAYDFFLSDSQVSIYCSFGEDSFVILGGEIESENQEVGFYIIDKSNNYMGSIPNSHLVSDYLNAPDELEWNGTSNLFVFTERDIQNPNPGGRQISITDFEGTQYRNLTEGSSLDENPKWNSDGSTILFQRGENIYKIDVVSGDVSMIFAPEDFGATSITLIDY